MPEYSQSQCQIHVLKKESDQLTLQNHAVRNLSFLIQSTRSLPDKSGKKKNVRWSTPVKINQKSVEEVKMSNEAIKTLCTNGLLTRFWSKTLIKFFGSELFDMGWSRLWKRQYFLLGLNTLVNTQITIARSVDKGWIVIWTNIGIR